MRYAILMAALVALPATLPAQGMPGEVRRRGEGPVDATLSMSDGEPISFVLEHAQSLDLSDRQRAGLIGIRRVLRASNSGFMRQLDSLAEYVGLNLETRPSGLTEEDRKKLQRFQQLSQPITDSIRVNNEAARMQARQLLDSVQVVRLDSIVIRERSGPRRPPVRR